MGSEDNGFSSLTSISFEGLNKLSSVGEYWMTGEEGGYLRLSSIDFSKLSSLNIVGDY